MSEPSQPSPDIIVSSFDHPCFWIDIARSLMNRGWGGKPNRIEKLQVQCQSIPARNNFWRVILVVGTRDDLLAVLKWQTENYPRRLTLIQGSDDSEDIAFDVGV